MESQRNLPQLEVPSGWDIDPVVWMRYMAPESSGREVVENDCFRRILLSRVVLTVSFDSVASQTKMVWPRRLS